MRQTHQTKQRWAWVKWMLTVAPPPRCRVGPAPGGSWSAPSCWFCRLCWSRSPAWWHLGTPEGPVHRSPVETQPFRINNTCFVVRNWKCKSVAIFRSTMFCVTIFRSFLFFFLANFLLNYHAIYTRITNSEATVGMR